MELRLGDLDDFRSAFDRVCPLLGPVPVLAPSARYETVSLLTLFTVMSNFVSRRYRREIEQARMELQRAMQQAGFESPTPGSTMTLSM